MFYEYQLKVPDSAPIWKQGVDMDEWISCEKMLPRSHHQIVLVTDGVYICVASYIRDPKNWYGEDFLEWDEEKEEYVEIPKTKQVPHWECIEECGGVIEEDSVPAVFASGVIMWWMPFPKPPREKK